MKRLLFLFLLLALWPGQALAGTTLTGPDKQPWMDRCLAQSKVKTPDLTLAVYRSETAGRSYILPWKQELFLADLSNNRESCYILRHEVGHLFDWTMLRPEDRRHVSCRIIGHDSPNPWWSYWSDGRWQGGGESIESPMEHFAEAYALAATIKKPRPRQFLEGIAVGYGAWDYLFDWRQELRYKKVKRLVRFLNSRPGPATVEERDQRRPIADC